MKTKLFFRITTALLISCLLTNCEKQDSGNLQNENVEFAFNLNTSHLKSSPDSCESLSYATKIVLTIETISGGATDYTDTELELYKLNGSFFSPKIALLVGHYKLTKLLLIDDDNNVLFAAPLEGSTLAPQAENPLPIEFEVIANQAVSVNAGVLCALDYSPEDFGLVSFWLNKVETFSFMIAVAELGENLLLDADLAVSSGDYSYSQHLEAISNNVVTIRDGFENYTISIKKEGYSAYSEDFTLGELKLHENAPGNLPLVVELIKNVVDVDGNVYETVLIGNQIWMAENLKTTHYPNGDPIPIVTTNAQWVNLADIDNSDAYCWYNNTPGNKDIYGALYTYKAAVNACPSGWHLPSDTEWTELENYISADGHSGTEGYALKSTSGWNSSYGNGSNEYGFSALPGGHRYYHSGEFGHIGIRGTWRCSAEPGSETNYTRGIYIGSLVVYRYSSHVTTSGLSVRCVKN